MFITLLQKWRGNLQKYLNAHFQILIKLLLQFNYRMSVIVIKILHFFSCGQNCDLHKLAEIEKDEVCHLVAGYNISWKDLTFIYCQLYTLSIRIKKILQSCRYADISGYSYTQQ